MFSQRIHILTHFMSEKNDQQYLISWLYWPVMIIGRFILNLRERPGYTLQEVMIWVELVHQHTEHTHGSSACGNTTVPSPGCVTAHNCLLLSHCQINIELEIKLWIFEILDKLQKCIITYKMTVTNLNTLPSWYAVISLCHEHCPFYPKVKLTVFVTFVTISE